RQVESPQTARLLARVIAPRAIDDRLAIRTPRRKAHVELAAQHVLVLRAIHLDHVDVRGGEATPAEEHTEAERNPLAVRRPGRHQRSAILTLEQLLAIRAIRIHDTDRGRRMAEGEIE